MQQILWLQFLGRDWTCPSSSARLGLIQPQFLRLWLLPTPWLCHTNGWIIDHVLVTQDRLLQVFFLRLDAEFRPGPSFNDGVLVNAAKKLSIWRCSPLPVFSPCLGQTKMSNSLPAPDMQKLWGKPMELRLLSATIYENKNPHYEC